jgi:hypothetical protein
MYMATTAHKLAVPRPVARYWPVAESIQSAHDYRHVHRPAADMCNWAWAVCAVQVLMRGIRFRPPRAFTAPLVYATRSGRLTLDAFGTMSDAVTVGYITALSLYLRRVVGRGLHQPTLRRGTLLPGRLTGPAKALIWRLPCYTLQRELSYKFPCTLLKKVAECYVPLLRRQVALLSIGISKGKLLTRNMVEATE